MNGVVRILFVVSFLLLTLTSQAMTPMSDKQLGAIDGGAFFWSDKILPQQLTGAMTTAATGGAPSCTPGSGGGCTPTDYTFYRMGLNATMGINTNIAKLQLGCGGVNDALGSMPCDIDMDYVSMMGLSGGSDSEFEVQRPYIGLAIKNDGSPTQRQVVGIKIGAQSVSGTISAGRVYNTGDYNQENGTSGWTTGNLDDWNGVPKDSGGNYLPQCTNSSYGNGSLFCNSGINSLSGFIGAELSLRTEIKATVNVLFNINVDAIACAGRLVNVKGSDCDSSQPYANTPLFVDASGTRMTVLKLSSVALRYNGSGAAALLSALGISNLYATLDANLRLLHHFDVNQTSDFFPTKRFLWLGRAIARSRLLQNFHQPLLV